MGEGKSVTIVYNYKKKEAGLAACLRKNCKQSRQYSVRFTNQPNTSSWSTLINCSYLRASKPLLMLYYLKDLTQPKMADEHEQLTQYSLAKQQQQQQSPSQGLNFSTLLSKMAGKKPR